MGLQKSEHDLAAKQQTTKFKAYSVMIWLTCIINKGGLNMGIYWGIAGDLLPQIISAQKPGSHSLTLWMDFL